MHLYVNNSEANIHFWIDSAPREKHTSREIRIYVCIYITFFMSAKLFMSSDLLGRGAPSSSRLPPSRFNKDAAAPPLSAHQQCLVASGGDVLSRTRAA